MQFELICQCGKLTAVGTLKPTAITKKKTEHVIHYSTTAGDFYLSKADGTIVCGECSRPALIRSDK